jgi:DNA topoisomerase-3
MKVCIAEKNQVYTRNRIRFGRQYQTRRLFWRQWYQVTYTFGHLCTLKEPNDYKPHWKSWFEQPAHASREIWDQSGGEFRIQKQFKIIKNYSTKPNWSSTAGMQDKKENSFSAGSWTKPSIKGSKRRGSLTTSHQRRFSNSKTIRKLR